MYRGGEEVLLDVGGQDATEAFEDVGHSDEAREILEGLKVGTLKRQVCPCYSVRWSNNGAKNVAATAWRSSAPFSTIAACIRRCQSNRLIWHGRRFIRSRAARRPRCLWRLQIPSSEQPETESIDDRMRVEKVR